VSIFYNRCGCLALFSNHLIRCALKYGLRREHADFVVTAFLKAQEALQ
jgi:hypothetical protein